MGRCIWRPTGWPAWLWCFVAIGVPPGECGGAPPLAERLAHLPWEFSRLGEEDLAAAVPYLQRVRAAGFTGVVLDNTSQIALPRRAPEGCLDRLRRLGEEARALGLDVIATVMNFGDGGAVLAQEPNLAEGLPVRDALFVVAGSEARLVPDQPPLVENPGFELPEGDSFPGWRDDLGLAGTAVFADSRVRHGGAHSLRISFSHSPKPYGWAWISQELRVTPFRLYRVRFWVKTEGLHPERVVKVSVWTGQRHLHYGGVGVAPTQDWKCHDLVFNSLDNSRVVLRVGSDSGEAQGTAWFDDVSVEEIGLLNVLRRPGCPLVVRGEDGTVYTEGEDFEPVADPLLGRLYPWGGFSFSHEPPPIRLTPGSRLTEGQRVRVSFYHAIAVEAGQVSLCLSCDRAYEIFAEGIDALEEVLHPAGYHIVMGEIRVANWDESCANRHLKPADLLVDSIRRCMNIIRQRNPGARIYAWSDMLDPWHNGVDNYYLCNGSWSGAAQSVPRDLIIVNWNYQSHDGQSPRFFAGLGFQQLMLGRGRDVRTWLDANSDLPGLRGVYAFGASSPEDFTREVWDWVPEGDTIR